MVIVGVGALACLFGARLSPHANVTLIGQWPAQLRALAAAPLRLVRPDGREERVRFCAVSDPAGVDPADLVLILTKSPGTARAAHTAARVLRPSGLAITLQNGLGNESILAAAVGAARSTLGVTMLGAATRGEVGVCYWAGAGATILAVRPAIEPQVQAAADLFAQAGFTVEIAADVAGLVWGKLAINAAINPLTALLRVPNGALTESVHARDLMRQAAHEVAAVAAAQQIALPFADAADRAEAVARATATNLSSMLQDVLRGAPTEIDVINGAVVRAAADHHIVVPVNTQLYQLVRALESSYAARL